MLICPETYYEENLKGKPETDIKRVIQTLKREISKLKYIAEHPDYKCTMKPSEATKISCYRLYLERAKEALVEVGGKYVPSRTELKILEFQNNIPSIEKIVFDIGGFFDGYTKTTISFSEQISKKVEHSLKSETEFSDIESIAKDEFFTEFAELHIGEWRKKYDTRRFGIEILDGTQWSLEIYYSNKIKPIKIYGDNAYPYNFNRLTDLIDGCTAF